jgi:hypothetical protein
VIGPSGNVRVMVATKSVDFRKGSEGLAALVRETMRLDPFSGAVYVFRAKRADRVKLILWDGTGMVVVAKRLELREDAGCGALTLSKQSEMITVRWRRSYPAHSVRTRRNIGHGDSPYAFVYKRSPEKWSATPQRRIVVDEHS